MKKVYILCGISGSGKSTAAKVITCKLALYSSSIHSADNYFLMKGEGNYNKAFNLNELGKAHEWNYTNFCHAIDRQDQVIVVDNTNLEWKHISPYFRYAVENGYSIEILFVKSNLSDEELFKRNQHGVSLETIKKQRKKYNKLKDKITEEFLENERNKYD